MASETQLKGLSNLGDFTYTEILKQNIIAFFDWGLINKGGFVNVNIPTSDAYGGDFARLRCVNDPRFSSGKVWEGIRSNWVWESGLEYGTQPINISGVFVNNTFIPTSGNTFYIDYPNGRIVFNSGISLSANVRVEYSYKWVNVLAGYDVPWLKNIQQRTHRSDNSNFLLGSGEFNTIRDVKLQVPFIAVEIADEYFKPYQLGGHQYSYNRVKMYVVGEDESTVDKLSSVLAQQNDKTIVMFDSNLLAQNNAFPLDYKGSKTTTCKTYPQLIANSGDGGYRYTDGLQHGYVSFGNATRQDSQRITENLWQRVVTLETEAVLTKI